MIDYTSLKTLIENKISSKFPSLVIQYENTEVNPGTLNYIRVTNQDTGSSPLDCTSSSVLSKGILSIEIFSSYGTGSKFARDTASAISKELFGSDVIEDVDFTGEPQFIPVGGNDESRLYQHNLVVPYMYVLN